MLIHEATTTSVAAPGTAGRLLVRVIDAGEGSSGIYPATTLEAAAKDRVFPAGTHVYLDHETVTERFDRPERSVKDLAGVLATDAVYEAATQSLTAEVQVFSQHREQVRDMAEHIGLSIRAKADVTEAKGGGLPVIERITEAMSVDFVTKAGRGGKVLELLESARRPVVEVAASDEAEALRTAARSAHGSSADTFAYVIDHDPDQSVVWFEVEAPDGGGTYQQSYTLTGTEAELTGTPTPGRMVRRFEPTQTTTNTSQTSRTTESSGTEPTSKPPADPAGVTEGKKGTPMGSIQIEESELSTLREGASRATQLENTLRERDEQLAAALAESRRAQVTGILAEAFGDRACKARTLLERVGLTGDEFDADAFKTDAVEAAAEYQSVTENAGRPRGLGGTTTPTRDEVAESDRAIANAFGRTIKEA